MIEDLIQDLGHSLGDWAYLLIAAMAMAETAAFLGFVAPGEFTVIFGGVLAGEGSLSILLLIGIVWLAAVTGDTIGFVWGRRLGRTFALRHGPRFRITPERMRQVENHFRRHGGKTIFAGRWIGFVRPLMPFTAGTSGMPYRRFIPYDVLGAGIWGAFFCLLGFLFWHSFTRVTAVAGRGSLVFGVSVALIVGGVLAFRRLRHAEQRRRLVAWLERQGHRPLLRPLAFVVKLAWRWLFRPLWTVLLRRLGRWLVVPVGRLLGPPLRFLGQRLTPGELGIELTTLLAIAAVGGYIFGLYTDLVTDTPVTPGDVTANDFAHDIQTGILTGAAKAITVLGAWPLVGAVLFAAVAFLCLRRRILDAAVLVAGFAGTQAAVVITKAAVERPRPPDPLIDGDGSGFPSGHAATAAGYVALAVILARALPGAPRRVALVMGSIVAATAIGLTRVYLRVHYLSDVTSGLSLGLAVFALCGSGALAIAYVRNNSRAAGAMTARAQETISRSDG